jgi:hypothetical protein
MPKGVKTAGTGKCFECGKKVGQDRWSFDEYVWHRDHLRCDLCGEIADGRMKISAHWFWKVCGRHGTLVGCDACGRSIPGGRKDPSTLHLCDICAAESVRDEGEAGKRFDHAIRWLKTQGVDATGKVPLELRLGDAKWFHDHGRLTDGRMVRGLAYGSSQWGADGMVDSQHDYIVVTRGLPDPVFEAVVVHELGHAWLQNNQVRDLEKIEEEGFCEVLAYRFLRESKHPSAAIHASFMFDNLDPIYGDGFRQVQELVERVGFKKVVRSLERDKVLPASGRRWFGRQ